MDFTNHTGWLVGYIIATVVVLVVVALVVPILLLAHKIGGQAQRINTGRPRKPSLALARRSRPPAVWRRGGF